MARTKTHIEQRTKHTEQQDIQNERFLVGGVQTHIQRGESRLDSAYSWCS